MMTHAVRLVLADFLSTFVFVVIAAVTGQARLAVVAAVATGLGQLLLQLIRGRQVDAMLWFGVLLSLAFGSATIALHDPRFVMVKPSIVHCALGVVMLRRGWMVRYLPARAVAVLPPALVVGAGRVWAVLMFGLAVAEFGGGADAAALGLGLVHFGRRFGGQADHAVWAVRGVSWGGAAADDAALFHPTGGCV